MSTVASVTPDFLTTWKVTQTVLVGDYTPPSFDPTNPVAQTGPDAPTPTQERNVQPGSDVPPSTPVGLGGIIASIFNDPFTTPDPSSSRQAGDSNGQSSILAPAAQNAPQNPSPHDNPVVEMTTGSVLVSLAQSQIVVGGMTFPTDVQPTTVAIEGQTISINPSQIIASGITINIPPPASVGAAPSLNSPASVSIDIESNNIVVGGHTFTAGSPPTSTVINGQTFAVNAAQKQNAGAAITTPYSTYPTAAPKVVTLANVPVTIQAGNVVIAGQTFSPISATTSVVINGQTLTINPSQVVALGTTIDIPLAAPTNRLSAVTAGGLTFSIGSTAAVISGTTYAIGGAAPPMTKVIGDQTVSFGPGGVGFASATVPAAVLSQVTAGGLTFFMGSTEAFISGTTYAIGGGAPARTTMIGGQTVSFGLNGVGFASTTIPVPTGSGVTAGGLTFSVGPTAAVISGTTYAVGNGAAATTAVIGGQTISFGPNGVGLASTTIPVPTASSTVGATPGLQLYVGSASIPSIQGAAMGTFLAVGVGILLLL